MKKTKFVFKVNQNNTAKVYCGGKWHKHITDLYITAKPQDISVCFTEYKTNKKGHFYTNGNEVASETKTYFFGNKYVKQCNELEEKSKEKFWWRKNESL